MYTPGYSFPTSIYQTPPYRYVVKQGAGNVKSKRRFVAPGRRTIRPTLRRPALLIRLTKWTLIKHVTFPSQKTRTMFPGASSIYKKSAKLLVVK